MAARAIRAWFFAHRGDMLEIIAGLMLTAWGIFVLLPFDIGGTTPSLVALLNILPEWLVGWFWLGTGLAQVAMAIAGVRRLRTTVTMVGAALWGFVAWSFILTSLNTGGVIYSGLACMQLWFYLNHGLFDEDKAVGRA